MKKSIVYICIVILTILMSINALAGDSDFHNEKMRRILFSNGKCLSSNKEQAETYISMLENAVYLTIDQSGNKPGDKAKLDALKQRRVKGIVATIQDINPETDFFHRSFTHRGWDFDYPIDKSNWGERKKILLNTAERIFAFERSYSTSTAEKKREAFCKILYYSHVLGDWLYDDEKTLQDNISAADNDELKEKNRGLIIAFARAHPGKDNPDIFWELNESMNTLFSEQSTGWKYLAIQGALDSLAEKARTLEAQTGGVRTKADHEKRYEYEKELTELLEAYLPLLLDDTVFFRKAFPVD